MVRLIGIFLGWLVFEAGAIAQPAPAPHESAPHTNAPHESAAQANAPHATDRAQVARARTLYDQGARAYSEGRYEVALTLLVESYRLTERPALLYNIANTLERLGRPAEAVEKLRQYAPHADGEHRSAVLRRIAAIERRMLSARRESSARARSHSRSQRVPPSRDPPWGSIALFGVAAAALGAAIPMALVASDASGSAEKGCTEVVGRGNLCSSSARSDLERAAALALWSDLSFGLAAAAAAGALVWAIVYHTEPDEAPSAVDVVFAPLPGGIGFATHGTF